MRLTSPTTHHPRRVQAYGTDFLSSSHTNRSIDQSTKLTAENEVERGWPGGYGSSRVHSGAILADANPYRKKKRPSLANTLYPRVGASPFNRWGSSKEVSQTPTHTYAQTEREDALDFRHRGDGRLNDPSANVGAIDIHLPGRQTWYFRTLFDTTGATLSSFEING